MSVIRVKFLKGEQVKYISHLDLMRTVIRVIRRAHIPVAYSQGFNPHQEISFGAPLPLGVTSEAEYVDIKMAEYFEPEVLVETFNKNAPEGIKMISGIILRPGTKSAMALVTHSEYVLSLVLPKKSDLINELNEKFKEFLELEEITVVKFNKKTKVEKKLNVRPLIIKCKFEEPTEKEAILLENEQEGVVIFRCLLKSGNTDNVKPELVVGAFASFISTDINVRRIHRTELYLSEIV